MTSIHIKQALPNDLTTLQNLGRETFYETFAPYNSEEQIQQYLTESFAAEKLTRELNHPDSLFFIVWEQEDPIGYLKVNSGKAQTELQDETSLESKEFTLKVRTTVGKSVSFFMTKHWKLLLN